MTEIIPFKKAVLQQEQEATAIEILSQSRWLITGALALSLVIHFLFFGDYYLTFDDAYVFHVYARNLAEGYGFSFNPGEISHASAECQLWRWRQNLREELPVPLLRSDLAPRWHH